MLLKMLAELFRRCENVIHYAFIPVVHAQAENEDDSTVWSRLQKPFKRKYELTN